jgi:hypothetical protein
MVMRLGASLVEQLRGKRCTVYGSDVRVRVAASSVDAWATSTAGASQVVSLESTDCRLDVDSFYRDPLTGS